MEKEDVCLSRLPEASHHRSKAVDQLHRDVVLLCVFQRVSKERKARWLRGTPGRYGCVCEVFGGLMSFALHPLTVVSCGLGT